MDLLDLIAQGDFTPTRPKSRTGATTAKFEKAGGWSAKDDELTRQAEEEVKKLQAEQDLGWGHVTTSTATRQRDKQLGRDLGFSQDSDRTFDQPSSERPKTTGAETLGAKAKSKYDFEDSDEDMSGVNELLEQLERKHTGKIEKKEETEPVLVRAQTAYVEPKPNTPVIATLTSQRSRIKRTISSAGTRPSTAEPKSLLKTRNSLDSATEEKPGDVVKQVVREARIVESVKSPTVPDIDTSLHDSGQPFAFAINPPFEMADEALKAQDLVKAEQERSKQERAELEKHYKEEQERRERQFEADLKRERQSFEQRLTEAARTTGTKDLSGQLNSQQEMLALLQDQLSRTHQAQDEKKTQELEARERSLVNQEQRLFRQAQMLEQDKQRLLSLMQQLETSEAERKQVFDSEQESLRLDREQLKNFQKMLTGLEAQRKAENAIERQKLDLMREQLEREREQMQEDLEARENDISLKETLLEQKRDELFRQIKDERAKLQKKSAQVDSAKQRIDTLELEIMNRLQRIEDQERNVKAEWERAERAKEAVDTEKREFEETAQKVHMLSLDIHRETESMAGAKAEIERERNEIEQMRYDAQVITEQAKSEIQRVENARKDLILQQKRYEEMRVDLVSDMHVRHKSTVPQSALESDAKFELTDLKRQQPTQKRPVFSAATYLKDLEAFDRARTEFTSYITDENQRLLRTKLEMETGYSESLAASSRPPPSESPSSSFLGDSVRFKDSLKLGSYSKPSEKSMYQQDY